MALGLLGAKEKVGSSTVGVIVGEKQADPVPPPPPPPPTLVPEPVWEGESVGLLDPVTPRKEEGVGEAERVERSTPVGVSVPNAALGLGAAPVGEGEEEGKALDWGVPSAPPKAVAVATGGVTVNE